jgi:hypothetical protein
MCVYPEFENEHQEILRAIFCDPYSLDILWSDVLSLMEIFTECPEAMLLIIDERVCFAVMQGGNHRAVVLSCQEGETYVSQYMVENIHNFLTSIGIKPLSN